ncbi:hypothetical protein ABPG72_005355 [Tetrahymena utriculariae]
MSQLIDQLIIFHYEQILNATSDFQKLQVYTDKFNELYQLYKENKLQLHSLDLDVNMYQSDVCFLIKNEIGGLENSLFQLKGKPKQMKKKLKTIGPLYYIDGEFESNKDLMIAALKLKKGPLKETNYQKYNHLQGFTFVHIFKKQLIKKKRSRSILRKFINMDENSSQSINQQDLQLDQNNIEEEKQFISQDVQIDISNHISFLDVFKNNLQKINLEEKEYFNKFEMLNMQIKQFLPTNLNLARESQ